MTIWRQSNENENENENENCDYDSNEACQITKTVQSA